MFTQCKAVEKCSGYWPAHCYVKHIVSMRYRWKSNRFLQKLQKKICIISANFPTCLNDTLNHSVSRHTQGIELTGSMVMRWVVWKKKGNVKKRKEGYERQAEWLEGHRAFVASPPANTGSFIFGGGGVRFHPHCSGNSIIQFIPQWSYRVCHGYLRHHSPVLSAVNDASPIHSSIQATWDFLYTIFWFLSKKKKNHPSHIQASQEMVHHSRAHIYCSVKNSSSGSPPET